MKRSVLIALVLCLFGATAYAAEAPDRVGRWDLGVYGAGAMNDGEVDDAGYIGMSMSYGMTPYIRLGVSSGWQESDVDNASEVETGSVDVMGDIIIQNPYLHDTLVPYLIVGLGVIGTYVTDENGIAPTNNGDDVDDTSFGWKIGAGLDWFVNDNWIVNFQVAWLDSSNDLPGTTIDGDGGDYFLVGGGLKFAF